MRNLRLTIFCFWKKGKVGFFFPKETDEGPPAGSMCLSRAVRAAFSHECYVFGIL
jgi:hypothetical protein